MSVIENMRAGGYNCHALVNQVISEGQATRVDISITVDYSCKTIPYLSVIYNDIISRFALSEDKTVEYYYSADNCSSADKLMHVPAKEKLVIFATNVYLYLYDYKECGNLSTFITTLNNRYTYVDKACFACNEFYISYVDVKKPLKIKSSTFNFCSDIVKNITLKNCDFVDIMKNCNSFNKISFINSKALLYTVKPLVPRTFVPEEGDPYLVYAVTRHFL